MKINLIAMGQRMPAWVTTGFDEYAQRLPKEFSFKLIEIPALKRVKNCDVAQILQKEGEKMCAAIPKSSHVIALDVQGISYSTLAFAKKLQTWQLESRDLSFLIGGPEGLSTLCLARAQERWSLSPLTFPHPLVRIIVAEQLYR